MTQTIANNINNVFRYKEKIFTFLVTGIVVMTSLYVFFLQKAIVNVVARENIVKQSRSLSTDVSELESKYFIVKNTVNIDLAHEKGFKDSEITSFISSKSLTAMANHEQL